MYFTTFTNFTTLFGGMANNLASFSLLYLKIVRFECDLVVLVVGNPRRSVDAYPVDLDGIVTQVNKLALPFVRSGRSTVQRAGHHR